MIEVFVYFLRLGVVGFGGPLALIATMHKDLVLDRKWIDDNEFHRALPLIKSMPGPVAFQTAVYLSAKRTNALGGVLAGLLFILPSFFMMVGLASYYDSFKESFYIGAFFQGMQAGAIVLIFWALRDLTRTYITNPRFWAYAASGLFMMGIIQVTEPLVIIGLGGLAVMGGRLRSRPLFSVSADLLWMGIKAGTLAFGTGLSIVPLLQSDVVKIHGWMTSEQFLDALAFGQITPGPILITATFIGYKVFGWVGAVMATLGVFGLPALHMVTWFPRVMGWMSSQKWINDFLLGSMAALSAGILLALGSLAHDFTPAQFIIPIIILILGRKRDKPSWLLILIGGLLHLIWSSLIIHTF